MAANGNGGYGPGAKERLRNDNVMTQSSLSSTTEDEESQYLWQSSGTPKLSELGARAIPGWVTHWKIARELPETKPCWQKGGPKANNIVLRLSRSRDVTIWYQSHSAVWCECVEEDVGPLREVDCKIPHQPTEMG
ncbi:hypothetical protein L3X38_008327 [Prunus dulcis]|uniref:Uncharacterized protein n=1 Tax=Prunus dulcis TaxID=3755 RepID=A0AAD4ZW90_PRUDU|nr:hypothetical protein L3X38_008327 [Prunus dulcis]